VSDGLKEYYVCRHCYSVYASDSHPVVCACWASSWVIISNDLRQMMRRYGWTFMLKITIVVRLRGVLL